MNGISNLAANQAVWDAHPVQQVRQWTPTRSDWAALNPQPMPPREKPVGNWVAPGNSVSLNPQPMPPADVFANVKAAMKDAFQFHAENPSMDRSVIVVGGRSGANSMQANRGIIIVGGRIQIR
jgi:hypothetical protein